MNYVLNFLFLFSNRHQSFLMLYIWLHDSYSYLIFSDSDLQLGAPGAQSWAEQICCVKFPSNRKSVARLGD